MAKTELEPAPDVRDVFIGDTLHSFGRYIEKRISITEQIKILEDAKKTLDAEITALMTDTGVPKVQYQGRAVSLVQGSRSNLNKEKLLLAGVAATTIQSCTDVTSFTYLLVGAAKK